MVKHLFLLILTLLLVPQILLSNDDKIVKEIDSLLELSKKYKFNVEIESAIEVAYLALDKSININYSEGKAAAYLNLAQTLLYLGSYEKSLEYLSFTEKEPSSANNIYIQFEISRIRGQIFTYLKLEKQSIREFQKCITISNNIETKSQRDYGLSMSYENLSVVYNRLNMPDSVFYFLSKNKDLLESIDETIAYRSMVNMYSSFGKWHAEKNEYELAEDYFAKTLQIAEKYQYPYLSQAYTFMGNMEMSRDNNDSALIYYNKALENLEITKIQVEYGLVYQSLAKLYNKIGIPDSAKIYREKQSLIENESFRERENSVEKALEVFLNEEKRNQNIQKAQSEKIIIILVISIFVFILFIIFIARKKRKKLLETKESLKNELNKSIKEVKNKEIEARVLEKKINESFNEVIELAKTSNPAFLKRFSEVYLNETEKILEKHPNLTNSELTLCALIFLNFSTKDIATYTFVVHRSVQTKKSRLRKKLNLPSGASLENYIHSLTNDKANI